MSRWDADFEKRFRGGPSIACRLDGPADRAHVTVLFGPSGSGKSTILRCLAGLERPDRGTIRLGATTWFDSGRHVMLRPQQRDVGFLFQDYALFPHLTAAENIAFGLSDRPRADRERRTAELLTAFGLAEGAARRPRQLSGGQQQRVALARAIARRPRLLLLDEPLSALDGISRGAARQELKRLLAAFDIPVVMVTHDPTEALALGDAAAIVDGGRVVQHGPVDEVFSRPADLAVARIVGTETVLLGQVLQVADGVATVQVGSVQVAAAAGGVESGEVFACIRADAVMLTQAPIQSSARNHFAGRVVEIVPDGALTRVVIDCGIRLVALLTHAAVAEMHLAPGSPLVAIVKATAIHLIPRR